MHSKWFYLVVAGAFLLSTAVAVRAADMPVKAVPSAAANPGGIYVCAEAGAAVAKSEVSGNGGLFATSLVQGNLTAAGGTVGGCIGGWYGSDAFRWGWRVSADYENITASAPVPGANVSIASRWSAMQTVRMGGADPLTFFQAVLGNLGVQGFTFPTFTPPTFSGGGINLAAQPKLFVGLGVREAGIDGQFGMVGGSSVSVAPALEAGSIWQVLNASGMPTGGSVEVSVYTAWPGRGAVLNNVFGTQGGPSLGGAANQGQVYGMRTAYNFAIPGW